MVDSSILRKIMATALVGFLLVGGAAVGCVVFGIVEIVSNDAIFLNDGLGEVLTVLGIYFTVPYLFCVFAFLIAVLRPKVISQITTNREYVLISGITIVLYLVQQGITDKYMTILVGNGSLALIAGDVLVLAAMLYDGVDHPRPVAMYVLLYVVKMAVQYNNAYETDQQNIFGPNGVSVMLFLCIPVIQFPMYVMGGSSNTVDIVEQFARNFNLFLSHLLSSLDIISLYGFAFIQPVSTANTAAAPTPFRNLILILVIVAFLGNNLSVIYLFYQRSGIHHAEIPFMPQKFREVSRQADGEDAEASSHQRRLFHYMLFMLVVCDVPMLLTRLELWRQQYAPLNIFVAKNIKGIADAIMLVLRADHSNELQGQGTRTSTVGRSRATTAIGGSAPANLSPSPRRL